MQYNELKEVKRMGLKGWENIPVTTLKVVCPICGHHSIHQASVGIISVKTHEKVEFKWREVTKEEVGRGHYFPLPPEFKRIDLCDMIGAIKREESLESLSDKIK
jgi:hypothetical protein